jgi:hypothetical protein
LYSLLKKLIVRKSESDVEKKFSRQGWMKAAKLKIKQKLRIRTLECNDSIYFSIPAVKLLARNDANMKTLVELGALELLVEMARIGDDSEQYGEFSYRKKRNMKSFFDKLFSLVFSVIQPTLEMW